MGMICLAQDSHLMSRKVIIKQEAHGPQLAHLSETPTADMQMACNIFPILLWQGNAWLKQFLRYLAYKVKMLKFSKRHK